MYGLGEKTAAAVAFEAAAWVVPAATDVSDGAACAAESEVAGADVRAVLSTARELRAARDGKAVEERFAVELLVGVEDELARLFDAAVPGVIEVRHNRVMVLGADLEGRAVVEIEHVRGNGSAKPGSRTLAFLQSADQLLSSEMRAHLSAARSAAPLYATYKWNGAAAAIELRGNGEIRVFQRCERRLTRDAAQLRTNLMKAREGSMDRRIAVDAVRAAHAGEVRSFVERTLSEEDRVKWGSILEEGGERAARAVVFVARPFCNGVFAIDSAAPRRGGRGKGKGKGRKAKKAAAAAPREERTASIDDVREDVVTLIWDMLLAAAVADGVRGRVDDAEADPSTLAVHLQLCPADFEPSPFPGWFPCAPEPDRTTQHWPGYIPIGKIAKGADGERRAFVDVDAQVLPPRGSALANGNSAEGSKGGKSSKRARKLQSDARAGKDDKWALINRCRATVATEHGEVPASWEQVRWDRDAQFGEEHAAGMSISAFLVPVEELRRFSIKPVVAPHTIEALQRIAEHSDFYEAWVRQHGVPAALEPWRTDASGDVRSWSFEAIGANYQGDPEGIGAETGNAFVPHGWHPAGPHWFGGAVRAVAGGDIADRGSESRVTGGAGGAEPQGAAHPIGTRLPRSVLCSYEALCALFQHGDAEGRVVKEGIVLHGGASLLKVRREDFGLIDHSELPALGKRFPTLPSSHELLR